VIKESVPNVQSSASTPRARSSRPRAEIKSYKVEGIGYDFIPDVLDRGWSTLGQVQRPRVVPDRAPADPPGGPAGRRLVGLGGVGRAAGGASEWARQAHRGDPADSVRNYMTKFVDEQVDARERLHRERLGVGTVGELLRSLPRRELITCGRARDTVADAVLRMKAHGVSQLPVLDDGRLVGIVTESDLLEGERSWRAARASPATVAEVMFRKVLRLGNIAILLAGAWALGRWLVRQGLGRGVATVVAALWMLHPLGVEPTLWISGRHDLLAAACTFGALAMWPLPEERAWTRVLGATALCALGVASKESAVVVPVLLAFDGLRRRSAGHALATRGWVWLVPWAGVLAVLGLRKALGIGTASASMFSAPLSVLQSAGALLLTYVPRMLSLRAGPTVLAWSPAPLWAALMALAAAAGLSLGLWATSGRRRDATLAWAAYGVTFTGVALAPLVLAVPVTRLVGNRYGHLPAAGLLLVAVVLVHRYVVPNVRVLWVKVVGVAVLFTCLAGVVDEASAWRDDLTLFGRAVTMAPEDGVARYHLGVAVHRRQARLSICARCRAPE
jgi:CBS domain-containing protein